MNGLDKIIEEILAQANTKANEILSEANEKTSEILEKGQIAREEWGQQFDEAAELECLELVKQGESANRQNRRRALLETRNQVIDEIIAEAKAKLTDEADKERFKITEQENILLNNSIDAIFEAERQALRDKAYEVLTSEESDE